MTEWIRIQDQLPPSKEPVIVCATWIESGEQQVMQATFTKFKGPKTKPTWTVEGCVFWREGEAERNVMEVTHWMPMPAPPVRRDYLSIST